MSESPERGPLTLDVDVAQWLHELADKDYAGDVGQAMNESLRAMMIAMREPADPWGAVSAQARWRAQRSGRAITEAELRQDQP